MVGGVSVTGPRLQLHCTMGRNRFILWSRSLEMHQTYIRIIVRWLVEKSQLTWCRHLLI